MKKAPLYILSHVYFSFVAKKKKNCFRNIFHPFRMGGWTVCDPASNWGPRWGGAQPQLQITQLYFSIFCWPMMRLWVQIQGIHDVTLKWNSQHIVWLHSTTRRTSLIITSLSPPFVCNPLIKLIINYQSKSHKLSKV